MNTKMFCFQCEQTANCKACTGNSGVCGKSHVNATLQDSITGALISLAANGTTNYPLIIEGLFTTITNICFNEAAERDLLA